MFNRDDPFNQPQNLYDEDGYTIFGAPGRGEPTPPAAKTSQLQDDGTRCNDDAPTPPLTHET